VPETLAKAKTMPYIRGQDFRQTRKPDPPFRAYPSGSF
jgi:hypothetical protein